MKPRLHFFLQRSRLISYTPRTIFQVETNILTSIFKLTISFFLFYSLWLQLIYAFSKLIIFLISMIITILLRYPKDHKLTKINYINFQFWHNSQIYTAHLLMCMLSSLPLIYERDTFNWSIRKRGWGGGGRGIIF